MSNHSGSYMLNDVLSLMLKQGIWDKLSKDQRQNFMEGIIKITDGYDGNAGEVVDGIAEALGYCYWCECIVPAVYEDSLCSKCALSAAQDSKERFEIRYGSLDTLDEKNEWVKNQWTQAIMNIEKYQQLVEKDFPSEKPEEVK